MPELRGSTPGRGIFWPCCFFVFLLNFFLPVGCFHFIYSIAPLQLGEVLRVFLYLRIRALRREMG